MAFLAQQLLAEALACGSEELQLQQLSGLLQLLQAASACAALPGADSALNSSTQVLVDTMSTVLQVCGKLVSEQHPCTPAAALHVHVSLATLPCKSQGVL
jgi:hypothetical protein